MGIIKSITNLFSSSPKLALEHKPKLYRLRITAPTSNTKPVAAKIVPPPWMTLAINLQGTKEVPGSKNNPVIMEWAKFLGGSIKTSYTGDSIPWCGLYVAYVLKKTGYPTDNTPLWARSWSDYGVKLAAPAYGAIMVFVRGGGGHVGFYVSEDASYYHILGGNQSDTVNVMKIAKNRCIGYRWPVNADNYLVPGRVKKSFVGKVSTNEA
jgi:uncharacterized protein (TIGR02594 family)